MKSFRRTWKRRRMKICRTALLRFRNLSQERLYCPHLLSAVIPLTPNKTGRIESGLCHALGVLSDLRLRSWQFSSVHGRSRGNVPPMCPDCDYGDECLHLSEAVSGLPTFIQSDQRLRSDGGWSMNHHTVDELREGAMLETCGSAGEGCTFPVSESRSQAMTGVDAPAGKVQPDAHRSPWRPLRPQGQEG